MAESAAFTWRVSSSTTSNPARVSPAWSHCESGPASRPILVIGRPSCRKKATRGSGSLGTLVSRTIFPVASTTQMLLPFKDTSIPA